MDIYVEHWSTFDAEETIIDGVVTSPAPFGDNTYRVVDENEGGVVAYFGTESAANKYAALLIG